MCSSPIASVILFRTAQGEVSKTMAKHKPNPPLSIVYMFFSFEIIQCCNDTVNLPYRMLLWLQIGKWITTFEMNYVNIVSLVKGKPLLMV